MKKIIFVINNLETGGVQKSLQNLLKEIHNKYDITLLTFWGNENFEKSIPENVKVIKTNGAFRQLGLSVIHIKNKPLLYAERVFWMLLTRAFGRSFAIKLMCLGRKKYKGYDIAISFLHETSQKALYGGCNEYVLKMITAKEKATWLHCDFALSGANNAKSVKIYEKFDTIIGCSEGCKKSFISCLPQFADKAISIRNCNDYEEIVKLAGNGVEYDKECFNIVTVARLSKEKALDRAIEAVYQCKLKGYKVKYHLIGSGDQKDILQSKVKELNLEDTVIFYGNQQNPYPYIKNADLFLLTSYHEAAPMVFDEAACLGVPVLATKTTSTDDMILNAGAGYVCENVQSEISKTLLQILENQDTLKIIAEHLKKRRFNNNESIEKIEKLI